jgi:hypothetical protein
MKKALFVLATLAVVGTAYARASSIGAAPSPDKEKCKNGGWQTFTSPTFKNQGDCVSFFASGGKAGGNPSPSATVAPTPTVEPTVVPTTEPTVAPTATPEPTVEPTPTV